MERWGFSLHREGELTSREVFSREKQRTFGKAPRKLEDSLVRWLSAVLLAPAR